ncbi:MAG: DNA-directed RNA polymerase subunit K [Candidatus Woesearchaeota archaeon]
MATKKKDTSKEELLKRLTKYEKARLIGSRALQISMGAPFMIKLSKKDLEALSYNPIEIAKKELEKDKIPIEVVREVTKAKARG